tara:strand:+ start:259 stop:900 length:642 start_codon:yes stop_codon:yes gene_type:complete
MKRVLIATPCLDGKVDAWFVNSLYESTKLGLQNNIMFQPMFVAYESILPMARNQLINLAYHEKYDTIVFIDDDEEWDPQALLEIVLSTKDVVAVPVVNKGDMKMEYNIFGVDKNVDNDDGFLKIDRCGTGFLKLSQKVVEELWESNPPCTFRGNMMKYICEYDVINEDFHGEDIVLCKKIKDLGYQIWLNPNHTVAHLGTKKYLGNFKMSYNL